MAADLPPAMRVDVLGAVTVGDGTGSLSGAALGGRRARVLLVALALSGRPLPAETLAGILWPQDPPPTWPVALRGVVSGLRTALAGLGAGGLSLIETTPAGYRLAAGAEVDVIEAAAALPRAELLLAQARYDAVLASVTPVAAQRGDLLLPGEDGDWWEPHRRSVEANAVRALELTAQALGARGDHHGAVEAARSAVERAPLDERSHRCLIRALDRAGDRAGVVQAFERCRALVAEELGVDPSKETVEVYLEALREQPSAGQARVPTFASSFLGREAERAQLAEALARPGLVSVTGPGGVGKSRLAAEVAAVRGEFDGGRLWVSLASVVEPALVASTVALELGVPPGVEDAVDAVAEHLTPLGRALLVLDGCEQVVDGVASLTRALLADCPQVTLVVTTRAPVGIEEERAVPVGPLPPPRSGETVAHQADPAVQLLQDRVRSGGGELEVDPEDAVTMELLGQLCRWCGGLPLALELAAAQLTAMPLGDLVDGLPAQASWGDPLREVARSSLALLDPDEEAVFRRLAVLEGPVGLPLVRDVVSGGSLAPERVIRILRELSARGLVTVDRSGPRWRYSQDDDLHRLAGELLVAAGEERRTLSRLVEAIGAMLPEDPRSPPAPYTAAVTAVLGSVRGVLGAALDGRLDRAVARHLAFRLHRYWAATNVAEGRFWLSRLLLPARGDAVGAVGPVAEPSPEREAGSGLGLATYALGYLSYWAGDVDDAVLRLRAAVDALRGHEDAYAARALIYLAGLADDQDRGADAIAHVRDAVAAAEPFGPDLQVAAAIGMGCVLAERADPEAATAAGEAIERCRAQGSVEQLTAALPTAAMVCWQVGDLDGARGYIEEAWPLHRDTRRIARVVLLSAAAGVALADGDIDAATDFATRGDVEATELGVEREVPLVRCLRARALLAAGDVAGAAVHARAAVEAALALAYEWPLALCLETAAVVAVDRPGVDLLVLAEVVRGADRIRLAGDRPGPPTLRSGVDRSLAAVAGVESGGGPALTSAAAARRAFDLLDGLAGGDRLDGLDGVGVA